MKSFASLWAIVFQFGIIATAFFHFINAYRIPGRHKSRRHASVNYSCEATCDAQFNHEFEARFNKSYSTEFFDFPIDSLLTTSLDHLHDFCELVEDRNCCMRDECMLSNLPKSPQSHICVDKRREFERDLSCLNATNEPFRFHSACSRAARLSIDIDQELVDTRGFSEQQAEHYHEQDLRCRFQACALEARNRLINQFCNDTERNHTSETVRVYYESDLQLDLQEFGESLAEESLRHFPRFCAYFLADLTKDHTAKAYLRDFEPSFNGIRRTLNSAIDSAVQRSTTSTTIELLDQTF